VRAKVALLAEYDPSFAPHVATEASIKQSSEQLGVAVHAEWVSTAASDASVVARCQGIWIAPGSPYKNRDKTLWAIRYAREQRIPCFGTCGGFQHMILEHARTVRGSPGAHAEYDPDASDLFIARLYCALVGREMRVQFVPASRAAEI
jgi:CTP synthase (UTP-ammonia lyase)